MKARTVQGMTAVATAQSAAGATSREGGHSRPETDPAREQHPASREGINGRGRPSGQPTIKPLLIDLPSGDRTIVDESDWPLVHDLTLYRGTNGYVYFSAWSNGRSQPQTLHSFLMGGARPGWHIDHLNGDKLDNRRCNLRFVSPSTNQANRRSLNRNNTSGYRGVHAAPNGRGWIAQIMVQRRAIYLGTFKSRDAAIDRRQLAELEYFGEPCPCP
jgi:hypothetical protein